MKKIIAVFLVIFLVFSVFGCTSDSSDKENTHSSGSELKNKDDKNDENDENEKNDDKDNNDNDESREDINKNEGTVSENKVENVTFTVLEATEGVSDNEQAPRLFDFDANTKWCIVSFEGAEVIFEASRPIRVDGYSILTGEDNERYNGRNPVSWALYGSEDLKKWELLDRKTDSDALPEKNNVKCDFEAQANKSYRYYKFEVSDIVSGTCMQISELSLHYGEAETEYKNMPGTEGSVASGSSERAPFETPDGKYAGSFTVSGDSEYTLEVGEYGLFFHPNVAIGMYSAYNWSVSDPSVASFCYEESMCYIKGLRPGKVTCTAYLMDTSYYGLGSDYYSNVYEYDFTVNVVPAGENSSSGGSGTGSYTGGGSYNGGGSHMGGGSYNGGSGSDFCSRCNNQGQIACSACKGKGEYRVEVNVPSYTSGAGGTKFETKTCAACYGAGYKDCPYCF